ncbi:MAG: dienelactone hydrolase family protein [Chitinophagaceae bacterium]|nr:dienelactone hydrolase family protein [Chitinophagaceae bacterium]
MRRKFTLLTGLFFVLLQPILGQQQERTFVQELRYLLYLPDGYEKDTAQKWPLMIFLHGSGESGTDLEKVKVHGPPRLIKEGRRFPFIVVSPQATNGWQTFQLIGLLKELKQRLRVNPDKVYLTGLSMGGYGTWDLATEYPNEFAAIAPVCGGGDTSKAWVLRHVPVWCFHGALDNVVPPMLSEQMVAAVKKYNPAVKFTLYPDANHDSWTATYNNDSFYTWLLAQTKYHPVARQATAAELAPYAGRYVNGADTVTLAVNDGRLRGYSNPAGDFEFELLMAAPNQFFIREDEKAELLFSINKKGKAQGFEFWGGNQRIRFRRLPAGGR